MQQDTLEKLKLFTEYLKHITTLSTASLILLTIFLEKLSRRPRWKTLVIVALCSFTLSLIASAIGFLGVLYLISGAGGKPELGDELWRVGGTPNDRRVHNRGYLLIGLLHRQPTYRQ